MNPSPDVNTEESAPQKKAIIVLAVLILVISAAAAFFYDQARTLEKNPNALNEKKITLLVNRVNKLIALPEGEFPTIATVSDPVSLVGNPFFAKAKIGDQILIYTGARKAFLFDPKANIIVEVASINLGK